MSPGRKIMPLYESVFIVRQDLSPLAAEKVAQKYSKVLEDHEGKVDKFEPWGLRDLAYRLRKNRKGYYFLFNLTAEPSAVAEMERLMRLDDDVLRCLVLRVEKHEKEPAPLLTRKPRERTERGSERRPERSYDRPQGRHQDRSPEKATERPRTQSQENREKPGGIQNG